jgi:uncharacterized membrane protein YqgA involved in biofilm formation
MSNVSLACIIGIVLMMGVMIGYLILVDSRLTAKVKQIKEDIESGKALHRNYKTFISLEEIH